MRGWVTGTIAALALTRLMATLLFGVGAHDPLAFGGVGLLLLFVSLVAAHFRPSRDACGSGDRA